MMTTSELKEALRDVVDALVDEIEAERVMNKLRRRTELPEGLIDALGKYLRGEHALCRSCSQTKMISALSPSELCAECEVKDLRQ